MKISSTCLPSVWVSLRTLLSGPVVSKHSVGPEPLTFQNFQTAPTLFSGKTASGLSHDIPKKGTVAPDYPNSLCDSTIEELKQYKLCQNRYKKVTTP
ncbi:hypothetical protein E1301_Tti016144 [Triplophysa tibetana]|uniref:Uncharacterized protein n=1 Tax=Triplophysa tibetana TaxID=1572043 RepID=A0A5A9P237_9TELE|nr:hypothetical protein E1301_Tti016144 [Triplophysa tibetana]